jgi:hypothetical protein
MEENIKRIILKKDDILLVKVPNQYFSNRSAAEFIYRRIKKQLVNSNKKNKILMIPNDIEISSIGAKEVEEYISNIDLWHLFDEEEEN